MRRHTRRSALRLVAAAGVVGTAGCGLFEEGPNERPPEAVGTAWKPPADEWQFYRGDLQNTARSSRAAPARPAVGWRQAVEAGPEEPAPSIARLAGATRDSVILEASYDDRFVLESYDAETGTRQWEQQVQSPDILFSPTGGIVEETLYLTDGDERVVAIDTADGTVRWQTNLYEQLSGAVPERYLTREGRSFLPWPLATPDTVYVQSSYGLHGLSPDDGREQWRLSLGARTDDDQALQDSAGLAVTSSRIWGSYRSDGVYSVEINSGGPDVTQTRVDMRSPGHPVVTADSHVSLTHGYSWSTSANGTLAVGVSEYGSESWGFPGLAGSGPAAFSWLASDGEQLFACEAHESNGQFVVFSLDAQAGGLEWLHRESLFADRDIERGDQLRVCNPCVAGDGLLVGYGTASGPDEREGVVRALSTTDGTVRWSKELPVAPVDMALAGDRLYVHGQTNELAALRLPDAG